MAFKEESPTDSVLSDVADFGGPHGSAESTPASTVSPASNREKPDGADQQPSPMTASAAAAAGGTLTTAAMATTTETAAVSSINTSTSAPASLTSTLFSIPATPPPEDRLCIASADAKLDPLPAADSPPSSQSTAVPAALPTSRLRFDPIYDALDSRPALPEKASVLEPASASASEPTALPVAGLSGHHADTCAVETAVEIADQLANETARAVALDTTDDLPPHTNTAVEYAVPLQVKTPIDSDSASIPDPAGCTDEIGANAGVALQPRDAMEAVQIAEAASEAPASGTPSHLDRRLSSRRTSSLTTPVRRSPRDARPSRSANSAAAQTSKATPKKSPLPSAPVAKSAAKTAVTLANSSGRKAAATPTEKPTAKATPPTKRTAARSLAKPSPSKAGAPKTAAAPVTERRATRQSGTASDLHTLVSTPPSSLGKRSRSQRESGKQTPVSISRELARLQDTKEFAHIDVQPVVYTVWSNGKYVPANAAGEPLQAIGAVSKSAKTAISGQDDRKPDDEPAHKKAKTSGTDGDGKGDSKETEESAAPPARPVRRVKKWLAKGLYSGQSMPENPAAGLTAAERKTLAKLPELSKKYPSNKTLPMPIYNGFRLLLQGRDFKLPFDTFNPLPPGQPKPVKYGRFSKNRFVGEAHAIWKKNPHYDDFQSKCVCKPESGCDEDCQNRIMLYECDDQNCNVGPERCHNREFQRLAERTASKNAFHIGVEVYKTENRGHGIRSSRSFAPGQIIMEYIGEIITEEESDRRMNELYRNNACYYLMSFDQSLIIDGTSGSIARFVNHSCSPNCRMIKWIVNGQPRIALFAGDRPIMTGEELTYDYNFDPYSSKNVQKCLCGSENCRGVLGPRKSDKAMSKAAAEKLAAEKAAAAKAQAKAARGKSGATNGAQKRGKRKLDAGSDDEESDMVEVGASGHTAKRARAIPASKRRPGRPRKDDTPTKKAKAPTVAKVTTTKAALAALAIKTARMAKAKAAGAKTATAAKSTKTTKAANPAAAKTMTLAARKRTVPTARTARAAIAFKAAMAAKAARAARAAKAAEAAKTVAGLDDTIIEEEDSKAGEEEPDAKTDSNSKAKPRIPGKPKKAVKGVRVSKPKTTKATKSGIASKGKKAPEGTTSAAKTGTKSTGKAKGRTTTAKDLSEPVGSTVKQKKQVRHQKPKSSFVIGTTTLPEADNEVSAAASEKATAIVKTAVTKAAKEATKAIKAARAAATLVKAAPKSALTKSAKEKAAATSKRASKAALEAKKAKVGLKLATKAAVKATAPAARSAADDMVPAATKVDAVATAASKLNKKTPTTAAAAPLPPLPLGSGQKIQQRLKFPAIGASGRKAGRPPYQAPSIMLPTPEPLQHRGTAEMAEPKLGRGSGPAGRKGLSGAFNSKALLMAKGRHSSAGKPLTDSDSAEDVIHVAHAEFGAEA